MRIIAGAFRGRRLVAPVGAATRPTADRMRQAIFDMIMHASWGGRALLDGATVLDAFAGTGAMGLEALSRGAAQAVFMERDRNALAALRANVSACGVSDQASIVASDVLLSPTGVAQAIVFIDPPYNEGLLNTALLSLRASGWIAEQTIVVAETGRLEIDPFHGSKLAHKMYGAAQVSVWREI